MANTFTDIIETVIMPQALPILREACAMPALVYTDLSAEAAEKNGTIRVKLPQTLVANDFVPASGSTVQNLDDPKVDVTLSSWKESTFTMTDKEVKEVKEGIIPDGMDAALKALANALNGDLWALYKDIPYYAGAAGTTPDEAADIAAVRRVLQLNLVPPQLRRLVLDPYAEEKFIVTFKDADKTGTTTALREASLGRLFGFDTYADQAAPSHTKGTLAAQTSIAFKETEPVGETTVVFDDSASGTLTGTLLKGDLLTFAGDTQQYVVTADATAAGNEISVVIYPGLAVQHVDADVVTLTDTHQNALAFHRDAFCLAMRPLAESGDIPSESSTISVAVDPVSNIPLRLETWRNSDKATRYWRFDILYGVKTLSPERAARLIG